MGMSRMRSCWGPTVTYWEARAKNLLAVLALALL